MSVVLLRDGNRLLDGRQCFKLWPSGSSMPSGARALYLLEFNDGMIKVGITGNPRARAIQHWRESDGRIVWARLFPLLPDRRTARTAELGAIASLAMVGSQERRIALTERFIGINRQQACKIVRQAIEAAREQSA